MAVNTQPSDGDDLQKQLLAEASDSSSSSGSDDSEDSDDDKQATAAAVLPLSLPGAAAGALAKQQDKGPVTAASRWKQAGTAVRTQVQVKLVLNGMHAGTKKMRAMQEKERQWFMAKLFMTVVALSVLDTETKACAFHVSAVGMYSIDGKPYKFSYSLFVALVVFLVKLFLGPLEAVLKRKEKTEKDEKKQASGETPKAHKSHEAKGGGGISELHNKTSHRSLSERIMPWALLFGFTFMEMLSTSLANYALNLTPTSIYIVFKSSKMIFVAIASRVLLKTVLRPAQWWALLLLSAALLLAVVAENKGGKKGGGMSLQGPIILIVSEMCHAMMLILQQVAVQNYWPNPMLLVSASAALGIPVTIASMFAAHRINSPIPPYHPVSDPVDVFVMCSNSLTLTLSLCTHLVFHVLMDVNHIVSLKHMSALARSLCDAVKLALMWSIGKFCFFTGEAIWGPDFKKTEGGFWALLAEPWQQHSILMIPGLMMIGYAMLMFKFRVYVPIQITKVDGKYKMALVKAEETEEEKANPNRLAETGLDDGFYADAFQNRKVRLQTKKKLGELLKNVRKVPKNKMQAAVFKMRASKANGDDVEA